MYQRDMLKYTIVQESFESIQRDDYLVTCVFGPGVTVYKVHNFKLYIDSEKPKMFEFIYVDFTSRLNEIS